MKQVQPDASVDERLRAYAELIERYHGTLDLVSDQALAGIDRLIEESSAYGSLLASLSPAVSTVLDVGSGVGLPGIPIALALPDSKVLLSERRRRRVSFLRIAVSRLRLANAEIVAGDVRALKGVRADAVTAQAVGRLGDIYSLTRASHASQVWVVSRKGPEWRDELAGLEDASGSAAIEVREEVLSPHVRLVAVLLPGGSACPR